ncbi:MAG: TrkA C-terminal domain-containing protein [Dehalococcoidales bacterium]|nr:TrkA C-terminal domain-containing protein [Dehalococcoidales bacterium]
MGLYLLIPTFLVIVISIIIVRVGAVALRMTGLDEKTARFQSLSAFTRAGFTTKESESVLNNPQRRSIITWLIVLGNAGIVALIVTGTSSLVTSDDYRLAIDIAALAVGLYIIYRLAKHTGVFTHRLENLVENKLLRGKFFAWVPVEHLLHLADGYGVARIPVDEKSPLTPDKPFLDSRLPPAAAFMILGIERAGQWIPGPNPDEPVGAGDSLIIYGKLNEIDRFFGGKRAARA